jgi:O-antigen/teichoic acid export membrane protein
MYKKITGSGLLTFRRSQFFRNTLKLVFGTGIAQVISIILSPILTRLYTPDDFGLYSFYIYIVAGFVLISSLRYELAIVFSKEEKDSVNVLSLSVLIDIAISILLLILVIVYNFFLYKFFPVSAILRQWLYAMPLLVFSLGLSNILLNWMVRERAYHIISIAKIVNSIANNFWMVFLGFLGIGAWGLFTGYFAGTLIFVFFLLYKLYGSRWKIKEYVDRETMKIIAVRHKDLPTSNTPQAVSELLQNYGIIFMTKLFFSSTVVGLYALSMRILQAPLWLIGGAILQVYMQDASEQFNKTGNIELLIKKTTKMAFLAALPLLILLLIAGPWVFGLIFGSQWREAGVYARILAPWMFIDFIRYSISQTPLIVGRTRTMFFVSLAGNAMMIISLVVGGWILKDVKTGFILLSAMMSIYSGTVVFWMHAITRQSIDSVASK